MEITTPSNIITVQNIEACGDCNVQMYYIKQGFQNEFSQYSSC